MRKLHLKDGITSGRRAQTDRAQIRTPIKRRGAWRALCGMVWAAEQKQQDRSAGGHPDKRCQWVPGVRYGEMRRADTAARLTCTMRLMPLSHEEVPEMFATFLMEGEDVRPAEQAPPFIVASNLVHIGGGF